MSTNSISIKTMNAVEREGGDITAADMVHLPNEPSLIREYFDDAVVFVTGATGFVGKLLVEKLLRACNVRKVYVLIRPKYNETSEQRFRNYFADVVFERLKRENYRALEKLKLIRGDCSKSNLGIAERDVNALDETNCVFNCASTNYFDDKLTSAVLVNVNGVKQLLCLCKKMRNLKSIVFMSTVYAHCNKNEVDEVFYKIHIDGDDSLALLNMLKGDMLEKIASTLVKDWPNVYTFTRAIAENVIENEIDKLPIAVVRSSLLLGTAKEPVSGWVNALNGASGVFAGILVGLIHTLYLDPNNLADLVPADYVVNCMLAVSYDVAAQKSINKNEENLQSPSADIKLIYNYTSTPQKPISWRSSLETMLSHMEDVPVSFQIWHAFLMPTCNKYLFLFLNLVLHSIPDWFRNLSQNLRFYDRSTSFLNKFVYFTTNSWIFRNGNVERLWDRLNGEDRKCFEFGMHNFDWDLYFRTGVRGLRVYLLEDSIETIALAKRRQKKLKILHYALVSLFVCFLCGSLYRLTPQQGHLRI